MDIAQCRAVIVGGASGMARATAVRIVKGGGSVAVVDRPQSAGAEAAAELNGTFHALDVTDFDATEGVLNEAVDALGGVDVCVNTAGNGVAMRTVGKEGPHDLDAFRRIIDLNLVATFNVARLLAWRMSTNEPNEDGERGVIINTASIAAFEGQIGQIAYTASKAGVEADRPAVEHRVLDDRDRQAGVLVGPPHPLGEGVVLGEHVGELVGDALGQPGGEQARGDRVDADAE